jgi:hypothetical protein
MTNETAPSSGKHEFRSHSGASRPRDTLAEVLRDRRGRVFLNIWYEQTYPALLRRRWFGFGRSRHRLAELLERRRACGNVAAWLDPAGFDWNFDSWRANPLMTRETVERVVEFVLQVRDDDDWSVLAEWDGDVLVVSDPQQHAPPSPTTDDPPRRISANDDGLYELGGFESIGRCAWSWHEA